MKNPYTRLPGRRWLSPGVVHKLWLGPDHLLAVAGTGYTESYQRFDYRDIQALISRRTTRRRAMNLAFGLPAAFILLFGAVWGWDGLGVSIPFALPFLLAVLVNVLRGPTCVSHLRTAVSVIELPSLGRTRSFERAMQVLRPRLEAAQGVLAADALEEAMARMPPPAPSGRAARTVRPYRGLAHDVLFGLLIALGLVGLLRAFVDARAISAIGGALYAGIFVALIAALTRQQESDLAPGVRRVAWFALGYLILASCILYGVWMVEVMRAAIAKQPPATIGVLTGGPKSAAGLVCIALALAAVPIGVSGLLRLRTFRSAQRGSRQTPPRRPA